MTLLWLLELPLGRAIEGMLPVGRAGWGSPQVGLGPVVGASGGVAIVGSGQVLSPAVELLPCGPQQ